MYIYAEVGDTVIHRGYDTEGLITYGINPFTGNGLYTVTAVSHRHNYITVEGLGGWRFHPSEFIVVLKHGQAPKPVEIDTFFD